MMEAIRLRRAHCYPTLSELEHSDWRYEFPLETRQRIRNQTENLFKKKFTMCFFEPVLQTIALDFEKKIFHKLAQSESDYLRQIIFKLRDIIGPLNQTNPEPLDVHENPATPVAVHNDRNDNSETRTGTYNLDRDWQEETFEEIKALVRTYGSRFWEAHSWLENRTKKTRSIVVKGLFRSCRNELASIVKILLLEKKDSVPIKLYGNIPYYEKRILYYINMKMASDYAQEIYTKLDTSCPNERQKYELNELIKAFLVEKSKKFLVKESKKHGMYIYVAEEDARDVADKDLYVSHSLEKEVVEIINEWCDHKIRILTQPQPTMQEIEKELSIWQTPGSKLQQWCLMKHIPMKLGPVRQRPDPLLEKVRSIWAMPEVQLLQYQSPPKHLQEQVGPAPQPTIQAPQQVGPTTPRFSPALQQPPPMPRPIGPRTPHFRPAVQQPRPMPRQIGCGTPCFGSVSQQPRPMPPEMNPATARYPATPCFSPVSQQPWPLPQQMGPTPQQLQYFAGSPSQHTCAVLKQPKLFRHGRSKKPVVVPMQQDSRKASPTHQ